MYQSMCPESGAGARRDVDCESHRSGLSFMRESASPLKVGVEVLKEYRTQLMLSHMSQAGWLLLASISGLLRIILSRCCVAGMRHLLDVLLHH